MKYCNSLINFSRFKTRSVHIGNVSIGGDNPIVIQSMTISDTMDTTATVEESIRMINAGCQLIRITAPSKKEANNLQNIKKELTKRGYTTPIVADIHFTPNAAEIAAGIVEKVRINPGNYADKKKFETLEYTDQSYNKELERIKIRFIPLINICKDNNTSMRIGTNHGSLSDRILSRYGDTPKGMVESAMEFVRICREKNYHDIVLSMKASNTQVMVQAYRLLIAEMIKENMDYPLHLGVTEAGEGEDGRIKSAVGIGTLLLDGIGDTIRVSLTESAEFEMPVAKNIISHFKNFNADENLKAIKKNPINPFAYTKRNTRKIYNIGEKNAPVVIANFELRKKISPSSFFSLGYNYSKVLDKWHISEIAADYVYVGDNDINFEVPGTLGVVYNYNIWIKHKKGYPLLSTKQYLEDNIKSTKINIVSISSNEITENLKQKIKDDQTVVLLLKNSKENGAIEQRRFFIELMNEQLKTPVIISRLYKKIKNDQLQISASIDLGALLIDGLGEGICITSDNIGSEKMINSLSFGILQATRTRISKTEYISCPSCGRTLFDLQETTSKIRKVTDHLKGIKIGIMGCIVNGPGEMADADYGYVGTGPGKITLYKERKIVQKNIPENEAVEALINLIKSNGDWNERK